MYTLTLLPRNPLAAYVARAAFHCEEVLRRSVAKKFLRRLELEIPRGSEAANEMDTPDCGDVR